MPALPPDVIVDELPGGVRITLPRRRLGKAHRIGIVPVMIGVGIGGACAYSIITTLTTGVGFGSGPVLPIVFPLLHAAVFLVPAVILVGVGWAVLTGGQSIIVITPEKISNEERAGVFRKRWSRSLDGLRSVDVGTASVAVDGRPIENETLRALTAVRLDYPGRKPFMLAPLYPRDMVEAVAGEVARRIESLNPGANLPPVGLVEETGFTTQRTTLEGEVVDTPTERPINTRVQIEKRPDGVTVTVPPGGFSRGGSFLVFGTIWLGITGTITFAAVSSPGASGPPLLFIVPFMSVFWLIGLGLVLGALRAMRLRYIIDVIGTRGDERQTLVLTKGGLFRTTQREWKTGELAAIRVGPSSTSVNNKPLPELRILLQGTEHCGAMAGAAADELQWVAWELRQATGAPP